MRCMAMVIRDLSQFYRDMDIKCHISYTWHLSSNVHGDTLTSLGERVTLLKITVNISITNQTATIPWGCFMEYNVQYIPGNMHTVFALLCFVVVIHWLIFPSGLLHWHCGNLTIAPVPAKQPWWIWINTSCEFIMNDCITTTKQSITKPCAYFLGYTVLSVCRPWGFWNILVLIQKAILWRDTFRKNIIDIMKSQTFVQGRRTCCTHISA